MDLRRHDLNLLVALEALLDESSVTGASKRLNLSQSAVSAALDRLRHAYGDPLLVRVGNRMEPTALARQIHGPLKEALAAVAATLEVPKDFDPASANVHLRLGLSDYMGLMLLPRLYGVLAREAPNVSLEVLPKFRNEVLSRLSAGELDVATAVDPPEGEGFVSAPLLEERFVVAMHRGHPLARRPLTLARLLDHPHVVVTAHGDSAEIADRALAARGKSRRITVSVPSFASAFAMLGGNDLVSIVPLRIARDQAARFGLRLRRPPLAIPGYTLSLCWHVRTQHDPARAWFRDRILAAAGAPGYRYAR